MCEKMYLLFEWGKQQHGVSEEAGKKTGERERMSILSPLSCLSISLLLPLPLLLLSSSSSCSSDLLPFFFTAPAAAADLTDLP